MNLRAVFIHLGSKVPRYLLLNLQRHVRIFPEIPVTLIVSDANFIPKNIYGVDYYVYKKSFTILIQNVSELSNRSSFRNNFWLLSLERLLAIGEYHELNPQAKLLHIESDVLLLPNFPWSIFEAQNSLHWTKYEPNRDVASLLYSPNANESNWLNFQILNYCKDNPENTDMSVLSEIQKNFPEKIGILPSLAPSIPEMFNRNTTNANLIEKVISAGAELFGGIFDPAAIGIWLCGTDPRNNYGISKIHLSDILEGERNFIDPSQINYLFDSRGNLFIIKNNFKMSLFNLHIHSKNSDLFGKSWADSLRKYVLLSNFREEQKHFNFFALVKEVQMNLAQGNLIKYIFANQLTIKLRTFLISFFHS